MNMQLRFGPSPSDSESISKVCLSVPRLSVCLRLHSRLNYVSVSVCFIPLFTFHPKIKIDMDLNILSIQCRPWKRVRLCNVLYAMYFTLLHFRTYMPV